MDEMLDEPVHVEEMRLPDVEQVLVTERKSYATPWSRRAFVSELTGDTLGAHQHPQEGRWY